MNKYASFIGIAGGTGSGKTSIAKAILDDCNQFDIALITQDSYYKDLSHLNIKDRGSNNYDHPDALDYELLKEHINKLIIGKNVDIPIYDFTTHTRKKETQSIKEHKIIILEGILALFKREIREMMDIKIYVDTPDDIRIIRRIKRDINERKRTLSSVIEQYHKTVRPMHIQFVEPTKKFADIIIPEGGKNIVAVDIIRTKIMQLILNKN